MRLNPRLVLSFFEKDVRLILRDPLLSFLLGLGLVFGVVARLLLPVLAHHLETRGWPNFENTYPMWVAFLGPWQGALLPGTVFGFLLLEEKEEGTLHLVRVTPLPFPVFLGWRLGVPWLLAFANIVLLIPLIGLVEVSGPLVLGIALVGALVAPLITLFIASFAPDKVRGFALTKFSGLGGMVIMGAFFLPEPIRWAMGCAFPPLLVSDALWQHVQDQSPIFALGGGALLLSLALIAGLRWRMPSFTA